MPIMMFSFSLLIAILVLQKTAFNKNALESGDDQLAFLFATPVANGSTFIVDLAGVMLGFPGIVETHLHEDLEDIMEGGDVIVEGFNTKSAIDRGHLHSCDFNSGLFYYLNHDILLRLSMVKYHILNLTCQV